MSRVAHRAARRPPATSRNHRWVLRSYDADTGSAGVAGPVVAPTRTLTVHPNRVPNPGSSAGRHQGPGRMMAARSVVPSTTLRASSVSR